MPLSALLQIPDLGGATDEPIDLLSLVRPGAVVLALVVAVITWVLVRASYLGLNALSLRAPRARFFFKMLDPIVRFVLWSIGLFIILSIFAPSSETLFAVVASVGIALGLGAQDLVKNVIGGLVILVDRPYQLGDRVRIGDAYGEIDHIGLRSTKLTTPDDTRVTIPNSEILVGKAWNSNSGVPDCQVVTDLFLPADADPTTVQEIGYEAAYSSPYLLVAKPVRVLVTDRFQDSPYLLLRIKAYVYDHAYEPAMQSDITARAKTELIRRGILDHTWARRRQTS